jgi:hypothetical protein
MVVVGLDAARAVEELARLAPAGHGDELVLERAERSPLAPAGAAAAIVGALESATG